MNLPKMTPTAFSSPTNHHFITEDNQFQVCFTLVKSRLNVPNHCPLLHVSGHVFQEDLHSDPARNEVRLTTLWVPGLSFRPFFKDGCNLCLYLWRLRQRKHQVSQSYLDVSDLFCISWHRNEVDHNTNPTDCIGPGLDFHWLYWHFGVTTHTRIPAAQILQIHLFSWMLPNLPTKISHLKL